MYWTGSTPSRSVRSIMQFSLSPLNTAEMLRKWEPIYADIQAFILSLEPPKYPFSIDEALAARGEAIFAQTCARCHGTYGSHWTYPNKVIPLDQIGTDPARADGISVKAEEHYLHSWFGEERQSNGQPFQHARHRGYQPPPLDGVWATAPYFHNGSAPTVYHVLNSKARPKYFTRSFRTGAADYDAAKLGWKFKQLDGPADPNLPPIERRKVYDTSLPGRGNSGHTFGDKLTEEERIAVIEYLKKL
jgi:mono/diheme cytochrome c family protein